MAVSPPLADLGEFVVTAYRMFIMAKKLITNRPDLAGITSNGGIRNEHQLTYKWELDGFMQGLALTTLQI